MPSLASLFDRYGVKIVSRTDKRKSAYVLTAEQRGAVEAAGIAPADERPGPTFSLSVLFDPDISEVEASYYYSRRSSEAEREPEPRMGRAVIRS